ncbi:YoaP domain-containing protein [Ruminococcaceae bacterium OttesenSCG-928-I18]|nr:YoaP domain-containing protein [Ruminococcaceae bacterium OttesenSCG-928-I18]
MPDNKVQPLEILEVGPQNLDGEHLCCAMGTDKDSKACTLTKKDWVKSVYPQGYRFWKLPVKGKAFLEAIPAEAAWCPIQAPGWLFLDCFWVSGSGKGRGYGLQLLDHAIQYAQQQGFLGLVALAGDKKRAFLSEGGFYKKAGFVLADTAPPYYELLALPLRDEIPSPSFLPCAKAGTDSSSGFLLYYSCHCPYTSKYVPLLQAEAEALNIPFQAVKLECADDAQNVPNPFPTFALFFNGSFLTNEILSVNKFRKLIENNNLSTRLTP